MQKQEEIGSDRKQLKKGKEAIATMLTEKGTLSEDED